MTAFLLQFLRISVPYVLASLGGVISERGGVVNLALEGALLAGAFGAMMGAHYTGSAFWGVTVGVAFACALQLLLGFGHLALGGSAILIGLALNLLALSGTRFLLRLCFDTSANSPRLMGLGSMTPFLGIAVLAVVLTHLVLSRTRFGLRLRACGESEAVCESLGVPVIRVRMGALLGTGLLTGLGGVYLAFDQHKFVDNMSAGRGYVALAAVIFSGWRPVRAALACLGFGLAEAIEIKLQTLGWGFSSELAQTLPYVVTLFALVLGGGRSRAPAALGTRDSAS